MKRATAMLDIKFRCVPSSFTRLQTDDQDVKEILTRKMNQLFMSGDISFSYQFDKAEAKKLADVSASLFSFITMESLFLFTPVIPFFSTQD